MELEAEKGKQRARVRSAAFPSRVCRCRSEIVRQEGGELGDPDDKCVCNDGK